MRDKPKSGVDYFVSRREAIRAGKAFVSQGKGNSISIGPTVNHRFVAHLWRFWAQGDEFYAAQRDTVKLSKISFHSNAWHYDYGELREPLSTPMQLSWPGWTLALQIKILVHNEIRDYPLRTAVKKASRIVGMEIPVGSKLLLNVILAPAGTSISSPVPPEVEGGRFLAMQLRSMGAVLVVARPSPFDVQDHELLARMHDTTMSFDDLAAANPNGEMMQLTFRPGCNVISVVPLRAAQFRQDRPR
jgi:hypothetical protein